MDFIVAFLTVSCQLVSGGSMYRGKKVSLVLPCLNEEKGLETLLSRRPRFIDEIIVADNGSTDASADVARYFGARVVNATVRGYGEAYQSGLPEATGDIIAAMDADNTYPVRCLESLIQPLALDHCDFMSACRFPLVDRKAMPWIKQRSNALISALIRKRYGIELMDSQTGMFAFSRWALPFVLPVCRGMEFSQQIKIRAWKEPGIRCREIWIPYRCRIGRVKFRPLRDGCRSLFNVLNSSRRQPA